MWFNLASMPFLLLCCFIHMSSLGLLNLISAFIWEMENDDPKDSTLEWSWRMRHPSPCTCQWQWTGENGVTSTLGNRKSEIWMSWRDCNQMKWKTGRAVSQNLGSGWERQTKGFNTCWANMDEEGLWGEPGSHTDYRERRDWDFHSLRRTSGQPTVTTPKELFKNSNWVLCTKLSAEQYLYKTVTEQLKHLHICLTGCYTVEKVLTKALK